VWLQGRTIRPRGGECMEWEDAQLKLNLMGCPLTNFEARNLNLRYAKQEFLWYLRGDRYDTSIEKCATLWKKIRQADGGYNSNYGQYIFPNQFNWVVEQLARDPDSRQASIVLLLPSHLIEGNPDVVCTYGLNFRIRNSHLNMTVMMRSNDIIFGLTNDVFCFSMLYRMIYVALTEMYPTLKVGWYTHFVNSLHVYERHYDMISKIIAGDARKFTPIEVPWPEIEEVRAILSQEDQSKRSDEWGPMTKWLNAD